MAKKPMDFAWRHVNDKSAALMASKFGSLPGSSLTSA
jgi:hypothetical protein